MATNKLHFTEQLGIFHTKARRFMLHFSATQNKLSTTFISNNDVERSHEMRKKKKNQHTGSDVNLSFDCDVQLTSLFVCRQVQFLLKIQVFWDVMLCRFF